MSDALLGVSSLGAITTVPGPRDTLAILRNYIFHEKDRDHALRFLHHVRCKIILSSLPRATSRVSCVIGAIAADALGVGSEALGVEIFLASEDTPEEYVSWMEVGHLCALRDSMKYSMALVAANPLMLFINALHESGAVVNGADGFAVGADEDGYLQFRQSFFFSDFTTGQEVLVDIGDVDPGKSLDSEIGRAIAEQFTDALAENPDLERTWERVASEYVRAVTMTSSAIDEIMDLMDVDFSQKAHSRQIRVGSVALLVHHFGEAMERISSHPCVQGDLVFEDDE